MIVAPDADLVTGLLRDHVNPRATCAGIARSAFGNSQETWIVSIGGVPDPSALVLRRAAPAGPLEWSDRATEVAALRAAEAAGLPVPRVWWWEPEGGTLDRAYVVMDVAAGAPPRLDEPAVATRLAGSLGRWLARLHRSTDGPSMLGTAPDTARAATEAELERWTARASATGLAPALLWAVRDRLAAALPDDGAGPVLLWGDPGPHNVLTGPDGEITAILDWELAQVGHPLLDLGAARWSCLGHLDRSVLTESYEREAGVVADRAALTWFEALACVSRSVMLLAGVRAALDGRSDDPNVLALGTAMVASNLLRASALVWGAGVLDTSVRRPPARLRPDAAERDAVIGRYLAGVVADRGVDDPRTRRNLKIAAALLACPDAGAGGADDVATDDPRRLVAGMLAAYRAQRPLLELYGPTTSIGGP